MLTEDIHVLTEYLLKSDLSTVALLASSAREGGGPGFIPGEIGTVISISVEYKEENERNPKENAGRKREFIKQQAAFRG